MYHAISFSLNGCIVENLNISNDNIMPLAENFYPREKWFNNLLNFYSNKETMPSREVLEEAVSDIAWNVETMCICYANFPDDLFNFLQAISNPLISSQSFKEDIFENVMAGCEETGDESYIQMAGAMMYLRQIFDKDISLINQRYEGIISQHGISSENLAKALHFIVKSHTQQVAKLVQQAK